jgi:hypothetical protein
MTNLKLHVLKPMLKHPNDQEYNARCMYQHLLLLQLIHVLKGEYI